MRSRPAKALGIFTVSRYEVVDSARRHDLVNRVRASLLHDQPADAETGPLIGLLSAADLTKLLVDKPDRKARQGPRQGHRRGRLGQRRRTQGDPGGPVGSHGGHRRGHRCGRGRVELTRRDRQ